MSDYCVRHGGTIHVDKSGSCRMCRATKDVMDQAGRIAELETAAQAVVDSKTGMGHLIPSSVAFVIDDLAMALMEVKK